MRNSISGLFFLLLVFSLWVPVHGEPSDTALFFKWYAGGDEDDDEYEPPTAEDMLPENVTYADGGKGIMDSDLADLKRFPNLKFVCFSNAKITDSGILALSELKNVRHIHFSSCEILTPAGIQALRERMPGCDITVYERMRVWKGSAPGQLIVAKDVRDSDIGRIADFPQTTELIFEDASSLNPRVLTLPPEIAAQLKVLRMNSFPYLPELPNLLRQLPKLEVLILKQVPVTDELLETIAGMQNLQEVFLQYGKTVTPIHPGKLAGWKSQNVRFLKFQVDGWTVQAEELTFLESLQNLEDLELPTVKTIPETFQMLSRLKNLKKFEFTPAGIVEVEDLALLTQLLTLKCNVGMLKEELAVLHERLPRCEIHALPWTYPVMNERVLMRNGTPPETPSKLRYFPKIRELDMQSFHLTDENAKYIRNLPALETLNLKNTGITDSGCAQLAELPSLRTLNLTETLVTDAGLHTLARFPSLRTLNLTDTFVTDAGLRTLSRFPNLTQVVIPEEVISEETILLWRKNVPPIRWVDPKSVTTVRWEPGSSTFRMFEFQERPQTEAELEAFLSEELQRRLEKSEREGTARPTPISWLSLDLRPVGDLVSDETLRFLARQSPKLEALHIQSKNVTSEGMTCFAQFQNLTCLTLRNASITDESLWALVELPQLESLSLDGCPLTDAGLKILENIPRLDTLTARGGHFTDAGMESISRLRRLQILSLGSQPDVTPAGRQFLNTLLHLEPESDTPPIRYWLEE